MQDLRPITKYAKGYVERLGRDQYLAVILDSRRNYYELHELDPRAAQQAAIDFCAREGIALQVFSVSTEVQEAHIADMDANRSGRNFRRG